MNASQLFVSTAAAVTMVGAIGFAYAQIGGQENPVGTAPNPTTQNSTTNPGQSTQNNPGMQNRRPDGSTGGVNRDAMGSVNRDSTGTMSNERMARADRN
jgi:hypothetical protein